MIATDYIFGRKKSPKSPVNFENLVASFQFENEPDFDNTTDDLLDSWGNTVGFSTSPHPITGIQGKVNNAWRFTGNNSVRIRSEYNSLFELNDGEQNKSLAFSFWVYFDEVPGNTWFFAKRGSGSGTGNEWQFNFYQGNLRMAIWNTNGSFTSIRADNHSFKKETWYHLSGYFDLISMEGKIFQNNVHITSDNDVIDVRTFEASNANFGIGYAVYTSNFNVLGILDEMRFWIGDVVPTDFSNEWNNGNGITI